MFILHCWLIENDVISNQDADQYLQPMQTTHEVWLTRRVLEIKHLKMKKKTVKVAAVAEKETQLKESDVKEVFLLVLSQI